MQGSDIPGTVGYCALSGLINRSAAAVRGEALKAIALPDDNDIVIQMGAVFLGNVPVNPLPGGGGEVFFGFVWHKNTPFVCG